VGNEVIRDWCVRVVNCSGACQLIHRDGKGGLFCDAGGEFIRVDYLEVIDFSLVLWRGFNLFDFFVAFTLWMCVLACYAHAHVAGC